MKVHHGNLLFYNDKLEIDDEDFPLVVAHAQLSIL